MRRLKIESHVTVGNSTQAELRVYHHVSRLVTAWICLANQWAYCCVFLA